MSGQGRALFVTPGQPTIGRCEYVEYKPGTAAEALIPLLDPDAIGAAVTEAFREGDRRWFVDVGRRLLRKRKGGR